MNVLIFGAQGSGKSTHAKYIAEKLKVPYLYTGDFFRGLEKEDSERGEKIRKLNEKGMLIPNEISIPAFEGYLREFSLSEGAVLDGYPRNLVQAESLPIKIDLIIHVTLSEKLAIERLLKRKRHDDTPSAIKQRIALYEEVTRPLVDYFRSKGVRIIEIDNFPPIEAVRKKIDGLLEKQRGNKNNA